MLHIEDMSHRMGFADLKVDGILDMSSLPVLKNIVEKKLSGRKRVRLQLAGVIHCDRSGIHFLRQVRDKVALDGMSEFLKMEIQERPDAPAAAGQEEHE